MLNASEGADLVVCSRDRERIEDTADELRRAYGVRCIASVADVSEAADIQRFIREASAAFERVDEDVIHGVG